jgi:uncharacterized protein YjbI with pentapeptide repeats
MEASARLLSRIALPHATLSGAHLLNADLIVADLTGADLTGANLKNAYPARMASEGLRVAGEGFSMWSWGRTAQADQQADQYRPNSA